MQPEEEAITVLQLAGSSYVEHGIFHRGERATSALLPDFTISVEEVCGADEEVQRCLAA